MFERSLSKIRKEEKENRKQMMSKWKIDSAAFCCHGEGTERTADIFVRSCHALLLVQRDLLFIFFAYLFIISLFCRHHSENCGIGKKLSLGLKLNHFLQTFTQSYVTRQLWRCVTQQVTTAETQAASPQMKFWHSDAITVQFKYILDFGMLRYFIETSFRFFHNVVLWEQPQSKTVEKFYGRLLASDNSALKLRNFLKSFYSTDQKTIHS